MQYRPLGRSGLKISPICLGTMMFGGPTDEATSTRIVAKAREAGINFIDTADAYNGGNSEQVVGRAISNSRNSWVVATKLANAMGDDPNRGGLSRRWVQNGLREELRFEGAVFTDDLSMGGAAEYGDIVARATAALDAGCDVLPVCNDRDSVARLLDELRCEIQPSSHLRLVRMRGRAAPERGELFAGDTWRASQELLAQSSAPPKLNLTAGNA